MTKVIDLFSGAGGLSLGAARAGFSPSLAVELDSMALETHSKNFPACKHLATDVAKLTGSDLITEGLIRANEDFGLIGGPPCQGFSTIGKRRVSDVRNSLFQHFFRLVSEAEPLFYVAENVTGIMHEKYRSVVESALSLVSQKYNMLAPLKVVANEYGAPTRRTRYFFIGIRKGAGLGLDQKDFEPQDCNKVTVRTALKGLPVDIDPNWITEEQGWQLYDDWSDEEMAQYYNNTVANIPEKVGHGESLKRYFYKEEVSGCLGTRHSAAVAARYGTLKHNQMDKKSKSVRLDPEGYCPTLRAGTDKTKGSFQAVRPIHYSEARVITPREAARLQGFPDWFVFHKTKWHTFRQIGNSVSPIVGEEVLKPIANQLR